VVFGFGPLCEGLPPAFQVAFRFFFFPSLTKDGLCGASCLRSCSLRAPNENGQSAAVVENARGPRCLHFDVVRFCAWSSLIY